VRPIVFRISYLSLFCLFITTPVSAELSVTNQWRIEQAIQHCKATDNALNYNEYWGNTVTEKNRETVCIAEQFAQLATFEGDRWLEHKAAAYIKECRENSQRNEKKYNACLQAGVKSITNELSSSCGELGKEGLWDAGRCRRLVSYIFLKNFNKVLKAHRPLMKKLMDFKLLGLLFNPIFAIMLLVLYVLDIVLLTDPGNWMRISKPVLIIGIAILVSMFLEGAPRFIGMGSAVLMSIGAILWNHLRMVMKKKKKFTKEQKSLPRIFK